jgi:large conductance mechanosensitive channel
MSNLLSGFKQFILRGNVIDLAVGVIIGTAFSSVVTGLVADVLTPLLGAIVRVPDFAMLTFTINGSVFALGDFLNRLISFLLVAASVYFFVVVPINALTARQRKEAPAPQPTTKKCPECLNEVPLAAKRCGHCTSALA